MNDFFNFEIFEFWFISSFHRSGYKFAVKYPPFQAQVAKLFGLFSCKCTPNPISNIPAHLLVSFHIFGLNEIQKTFGLCGIFLHNKKNFVASRSCASQIFTKKFQLSCSLGRKVIYSILINILLGRFSLLSITSKMFFKVSN